MVTIATCVVSKLGERLSVGIGDQATAATRVLTAPILFAAGKLSFAPEIIAKQQEDRLAALATFEC